jgi:aspartate 1-decarboxylase
MMVDNSGISLQVYEIEAKDKDRDIVRIDPDIMHKLNISDGDFISVIGPLNGTKIICLSLLPSDKSKQIIRIDSKTRKLIGTTIGGTVIIKKVALINEENNKARKMNAAEESDEVSNSIIVNGSY